MSKGWSICQKGGPFVKRVVHLSKGWSICQKGGPFVKRCGPFVKGVPGLPFTYTTAELSLESHRSVLSALRSEESPDKLERSLSLSAKTAASAWSVSMTKHNYDCCRYRPNNPITSRNLNSVVNIRNVEKKNTIEKEK